MDLPGYGGSDSLAKYSPENVLEAIAAFILGIREKHHAEGAKVALVTHDWGGIIGARLASEAPQLADRFIIMSAVLVRLRPYSQSRVQSLTLGTAAARPVQRLRRPCLIQTNASHLHAFAFEFPAPPTRIYYPDSHP